jgi:hypothetical protein
VEKLKRKSVFFKRLSETKKKENVEIRKEGQKVLKVREIITAIVFCERKVLQ